MLWLLACAPEYGLHAVAPVPDPMDEWDLGLAPGAPSAGSAEAVLESPDRRTEVFDLGATERIDVLFVLDESISMEDDLNALRTGMASLVGQGAWPERTRFAVTSTTPGSEDGDRRRHHAVTKVRGLPGYAVNPGFLRFVDRQGIEQFRALLPQDRQHLFALDGCGPTFAPDERNAQGIPCLLANTQIGLLPTRVEAGSVALKQLLERGEGRTFREGASVEVIFVSDTHEPGFFPFRGDEKIQQDFEDLLRIQPSFEELRELAGPDLASFRLHAIAPGPDCGESSAEHIGPSYFELVGAGGGLALDFCSEEDWTPLIQRIVDGAGRLEQPILVLEEAPSELWSVRVDEVEVGYALQERLVILDTPPRPGSTAEVRYRR